MNKGASIVARIEGLMLDGDANQTQTDLPVIERELEPLERIPDDAAEGYSGMSIWEHFVLMEWVGWSGTCEPKWGQIFQTKLG